MLYGDDDTMFFVEGVLDLVKDLDPDMPYFVTGTDASLSRIDACQRQPPIELEL